MTETHGQLISTWTYPPPYHIYNWPSWEHMVRDELEFADPVVRKDQYAAVVDDQGKLCGFAQFFPISGVTRLGLGLRPDLLGLGTGAYLTSLLVIEAKKRAPRSSIDLEVLTWNIRAQRSYLKAGFKITDTYIRSTPRGLAAFHCMVYEKIQNDH
ncbi:GNAT family N-acetyltransferase [Paenibacillus sp. GP183]|uniref:GNAT family N-acetyltransferase n=1 Tax=Paenibacillus sp. GP183 TaxID=1882751 RepID=UPI00209B46CC|nr:GNAT family N-acetyltransferase [Paenibacillus sp. GP183]